MWTDGDLVLFRPCRASNENGRVGVIQCRVSEARPNLVKGDAGLLRRVTAGEPMDREAQSDSIQPNGRRPWGWAAGVLGSLAVSGALATAAIYKKAEQDTKARAGEEIVRTGMYCELTGEAAPASGGAGFVLKAECADGSVTFVSPALSLWTRVIEAAPSDKKTVTCVIRRNGNRTDCREPAEFAERRNAGEAR